MKTSQQVYIGRNKDGKEEVSRKIEFFISRLISSTIQGGKACLRKPY